MKIAIIGAGNMGGAIAHGLVKGSVFQPSDIICADRSKENLDSLQMQSPGIRVTTDNMEAVNQAGIVVLAVKPWIVESILEEIKYSLDYDRQILISIAAGVTIEQLEGLLRQGNERVIPSIFRVMPNTAISVQSSMTFVSASGAASEEQAELVLKIFGELGNSLLIEERLMGAGMSLASCGIAYAMRYVRAAMEGGVELGFYPGQAQEIVLQTMKGAVELLMANGTNPEQEIDKVTTPGGFTIKGLNEMEMAGFTAAVIRGLKASR